MTSPGTRLRLRTSLGTRLRLKDNGLKTRTNSFLALGHQRRLRFDTRLGTRLGTNDYGLETKKKLFQAEHFRLKSQLYI